MNQNWTDATLWMSFIAQLLVQALGVLLFLGIATLLYIAHRDPKNKEINLNTLLYDPKSKCMSMGKLLGLLGGGAATWVFVYLAVAGRFDALYATGYLTIMILGKVAADVTNKMK